MFFDTPVYYAFLAVVVAIYWILSHRSQNLLLLAASYFFYGWWDWRFLILLWISTVVDHRCALLIDAAPDGRRRKALLTFSLVMNFGFLGYFKYVNFFEDSFVEVLRTFGFTGYETTFAKVILPPGISFYTFQAVAYIVDVYFRRLRPTRSLVEYGLFVALFPHLIAGPIQRPSHLLPQVETPRAADPGVFFDGLMLILTGLFRKCVVADNCAIIANAAFSGRLGDPNAAVLALGAYAFAWQIYGDFSGYTNMARGSAQLLGFHFMVNFRQPYLAEGLQDFWRRWHISLSTWLRDYLYIPLGGSRRGEAITYRNLFLTMAIGGLWHGANWTFMIWGMLHGVGLVAERFWRILRGDRGRGSAFKRWAARAVTFHVVCLAWVFFRADSVSQAAALLGGIGRLEWRPEYAVAAKVLAAFSLPLFIVDLVNERRGTEYVGERSAAWVRIGIAVALMGLVALLSGNSADAFIYFQF